MNQVQTKAVPDNEPHHEKPVFLHVKTVTAQLISPFVFSTYISRVDSRVRECDNYAYFAILARNFELAA